jgi:hypothetical protein
MMHGLSLMPCPVCGEPNERNADVCKQEGHSMGSVNVNIYSDPHFQEGLEQRYRQETAAASEPGALAVFEQTLRDEGQALINIKLEALCDLINKGEDYLPYRMAVEQGKRDKMPFLQDKDRCAVEASFYGVDGGKIVYAALALDDEGLVSYGKQTIVLKTKNIARRTTVFERDTYLLFYDFLDQGWRILNAPVPTGYSAVWEDRGKLAVCKHGAELSASGAKTNFAALILRPGTDHTDDEFLELHIFNKVNPVVFDRIILREKPKSPFLQLQLELMKDKAATLGITTAEQ